MFAVSLIPYRLLCNGVKREGVKPSPDLASWLFRNVPLHKIRYGIQEVTDNHFALNDVGPLPEWGLSKRKLLRQGHC